MHLGIIEARWILLLRLPVHYSSWRAQSESRGNVGNGSGRDLLHLLERTPYSRTVRFDHFHVLTRIERK